MADSDFRTNISFDGQPVVLLVFCRRIAGAHDEGVADIFADGPLAGIVNKVGILFCGDSFQGSGLSKAKHIGLAQQDIDLHRLAHVSVLAIRIRKDLGDFTDGRG